MQSSVFAHLDKREKTTPNARLYILVASIIAILLLGVWKLSEPAQQTQSPQREENILAKQDIKYSKRVNSDNPFAAIDKYASSLTPLLVLQMKGTAVSMAQHYATGGYKVSDITVPTDPPHYLQRLRFNGIMIPAYLEDENNTVELPIGVWAKAARHLYPTTNDYFPSIPESRQWIGDALGVGFRTDGEYATWVGVSSDADMTRWGFFSMGSHLTRKVRRNDRKIFGLEPKLMTKIVYVNDATAMSLYEVREGFVRFGAAAFFNQRKKIEAIYVSYMNRVFRSCDPEWDHAKFVWKSSLMTQVTFYDHLLHTHFVEANTLSIACRENLPADHPLRRFLKAHIFRTDGINRSAFQVALAHGELFHATWSFTYDSIYAIFADFRNTYTYRPFFYRIRENGMLNESPLEYPLKDAIPYWKTIERYVRRYLDIYYPNNRKLQADKAAQRFWRRIKWGLSLEPVEKKLTKEDLGEVLTHLIVVVSALHEMYGTVVPITGYANGYATKLRKGQTQADIQAFGAVGALAVTLSGEYPLIGDDYSFLFLQDKNLATVMKNFRKFQADLKQLTVDVTKKNQKRAYPFFYFDPQYIECSVSF